MRVPGGRLISYPHRLFIISCLLMVQGGATDVLGAGEETLPEEITVIGQKPIAQLEQEIQDAKEVVYGLYNELNTDDRYDIHCRWERPTNTRFRYRICRPGFLIEAQASTAVDFMSRLNNFGGGFTSSHPIAAEYARQLPVLKEKLEKALQESPELADAMRAHLALEEELAARSTAAD